MAKKTFEQEPAVRKSFLVVGGVAIAAVLMGFVLMTFVFGGGGGGGDDVAVPTPAAQTSNGGGTGTGVAPQPTPVPVEPAGLQEGGRNPFAQRGL